MFLEDRSIMLIIYCLITVNYFIILYFIITSGYGCDCSNIVYIFFLQNVYYIKT